MRTLSALALMLSSLARPSWCFLSNSNNFILKFNHEPSILHSKIYLNSVNSQRINKALSKTTLKVLKENDGEQLLVGEDSAFFSVQQQRVEDWIKFSVATSTVLGVVSYLWFLPPGPHLGDNLLHSVQSMIGTTSPDATIFALLTIFAVSHSGLAGLRPYAEGIVGPRVWRVVFATVSLPLALSCISYFVNHSHEGVKLWDVTNVPGVHAACWITNFVSFLFLYPSTFNLLEIAAIEEPKLHLWETGIIRITRHPQSMGQIAWCIAHCAWLGTSTAISASAVLILHHLYSIWHGDRRLERQYPEKFAVVKSRTSVVPFQAILDGRQKLPDDYYSEFLRGPYAIVVCGTIIAYFFHPWMMAGAALLKW
mmetsp:Transcript_570/g.1019  ORF Transcript_570/g.1019 Transcript_570/m.1019 type:complete len:367 (-) Transcript_570:1453-2553(-)